MLAQFINWQQCCDWLGGRIALACKYHVFLAWKHVLSLIDSDEWREREIGSEDGCWIGPEI